SLTPLTHQKAMQRNLVSPTTPRPASTTPGIGISLNSPSSRPLRSPRRPAAAVPPAPTPRSRASSSPAILPGSRLPTLAVGAAGPGTPITATAVAAAFRALSAAASPTPAPKPVPLAAAAPREEEEVEEEVQVVPRGWEKEGEEGGEAVGDVAIAAEPPAAVWREEMDLDSDDEDGRWALTTKT
ncbi:hypothetical protein HDU96_001102, partial [Phlyctochytrium bullatum]